MQVLKATSSKMRLLVSLNVHYNNNLNIKVQKQNEAEIKKLQTKVVDSMTFSIHGNRFSQQTSSFSKFSVKTICKNLSGINCSYTYRLHFVLVIRIYFDKVQAARSSQFIFKIYVQNQVLYRIQQRMHKSNVIPFSFYLTLNEELKLSLIKNHCW